MRIEAQCCFISGFIAIATSASAQNLLRNGGFEDVFDPDHPLPRPYYWFSGNPNDSVSTLEAHTGDYSMHVTSTSSLMSGPSQGDGYIGVPSMPPVIPATPGVAYELGTYLLHRSDYSMHDTGHVVGLAMGFYNADHESVGYRYEPFLGGFSGGPISGPLQIDPLSEDVWHYVSISAVAPDDAIGVWVHLRINTNDQNRLNGSVFFDDASLRVVPAPGAMALFGVCAAALRRRR